MVFGFLRRSTGKKGGRGTNPASIANLVPGGPKQPTEAQQMDMFSKTAQSMAQAVEAMDKFNQTMQAKFAPPMDDMPDIAEGGDFLSILESILPYVGPYIGPYIPGLIEKFTGVQPAQAQTTLPPDSPNGPQKDNATQLKLALKMPDSLWTRENIKGVLAQNGLGGLEDEDIKALAQKMNKAF